MDKFKNLIDVIEHRINGDKGIFFIDDKEDKFISYNELYYKALKILKELQAKGLKKGSEVIFQIENNENFLVLFWACLLGGIIPVPVSIGNNKDHKLKLFKIIDTLNNPSLITDIKILNSLEKFSTENGLLSYENFLKTKVIILDNILNATGSFGSIEIPKGNDIAYIQFTSGTTGDPKGIVLTHENLLSNTNAIVRGTKGSSEDTALCWMPLAHDMAFIGFHLSPLVANVNQHFIPTSLFIRKPHLWLKKASEYKVSVLACPNFGYKYFLDLFKPQVAVDWDLSSVRVILNGAEYISSELCDLFLEKMSKYGLNRNVMFGVYGAAEACIAITFPPIGEGLRKINLDRNYLSINDEIREVKEDDRNAISFVNEGYPVSECQVRICNENNSILEEKRVGFIHIKGKNVTDRYHNNKIETEKYIAKDGWVNTNDLGVMVDGRLIFIGRFKDAIIYNGKMYHPHHIETIAEEAQGIELGRIAACGVPNNESNEHDIIVCLYYKKKIEDFASISENLKNLIESRIGLKVKKVIPIKDMPKTTSGKIQRYKLIEKYLNGEYNDVLIELEKFQILNNTSFISNL
ncbi:AMP-binding protein [Clostridium sp. DJ247]|uniref:AMP-binding protein n=1 Tax=Clostridium sp. DJ247 TaxID=2726188 RepID=UPI0016238CD6|nr:AMP-binding protein [Clostridium sp. DJ247]MBC2582105.1 AMP-binding protein [Clostridium sp. DJ247]